MVSGAFAAALEERRGRFNATFLDVARVHPSLDPADFANLLTSTVAPIVDAVDRVEPQAVPMVAEALYDLSLDMVSQNLLGPSSRYQVLAEAWRNLLPEMPRLVANSPQRLVGSITNALYNLARTPGARPQQWMADMHNLADLAETDVDSLLRAGQVAAWRAGMAQYREGALALCRVVEPRLAIAALGLDATLPFAFEELLTNVEADPWLTPAKALSKARPRTLHVVMRAGGFRGFGGLFMKPPTVQLVDGEFVVEDGTGAWTLVADCFGATFHRRADGDHPTVSKKSGASGFQLDRRGRVTMIDGPTTEIAELKEARSWASDQHTLAVTTSLSHAVILIAATDDEHESTTR